MNFTDSTFERMMKQKPYTPHRDRYPDAPDGRQRDSEHKQNNKHGNYRLRGTSGRFGPKSAR